MKMTKKLLTSSTLIAALALAPVAAYADGVTGTTTAGTTTTSTTTSTDGTATATSTVEDVQPGMTPDSFFYFFKQLARDINLLVTFNDDKKADLLLQYANEKAAELKALAAKGNNKYDEEQMKEIEVLLTQANDLLEKKDGADTADKQDDADQTQTDSTEKTEAGTTTSTDTPSTTDATGTVTTGTEKTGTATSTTSTDSTATSSSTTNTTTDDQKVGKMSPEQAIAILKSLLDKLPESGRKGVENAIKHLEKNLEKHNKHKHQDDEDAQGDNDSQGDDAKSGTTTDQTGTGSATDSAGTTNTTGTASTPATGTPSTDSTSTAPTAPTSDAAATPAPNQAPAPVVTIPLNEEAKTATTTQPQEQKHQAHHDNGNHYGWNVPQNPHHQDNNSQGNNDPGNRNEHGKK
ncbi:DUF5667 domain-containing protein [Tumebacillus flagellatus]|uniref:DUF5667 domain-containing protein n=1 Tax=Tumebacillus flagellatus TaxID=1157490 RepID=A0A074LKR5_9BACL|nr:DUF5667 domain-containing protein [Tumebacillus flagellatus]KEO81135.1 hypothetical protein EL26_22380 [Tumebacillus flagellatus]